MTSPWKRLWKRGPPALLLAFLALFAMYVANPNMGIDAGRPRGDGHHRPIFADGDGHMLFLMVRSTVLDRDWHFDNDLARFGDPWSQPVSAAGRKGIPHPIGPALIWAPLFAVAHGAALVANHFGAGIETHGYTAWHQRIVFSSSVLFACGSVLFGFRLARRLGFSERAATSAAIAVFMGTSLTYYAAIMASYAHAMDAFFCGAFLYAWATTLGRRDARRSVALGLLLGVAALVRTQNLALGAVVAVELGVGAVTYLRATERSPCERARSAVAELGAGVVSLVAAALTFTPQLVMWKVVYGAYHLPHGAIYTRWTSPMVAELLYSARNGWFTSTPIAYPAAVGLAWLALRRPSQRRTGDDAPSWAESDRLVVWGLVVAVAVQLYTNSVIMDWWGQSSFGARRLASVTTPLVVGLAFALQRGSLALGSLEQRTRSLLALIVLGAPVIANLSGAWALRGSKAAPVVHSPTCCSRLSPVRRRILEPLYERVGNPLELPASLAFALKHRTGLARWDQTVGPYPIILEGHLMASGQWTRQRGRWEIGAPGAEPFLLGGLGPSLPGRTPVRITTGPRARILLPNLIPAAQRYALWMQADGDARVRVLFEGRLVAEGRPSMELRPLPFNVDAPPVGVNELWIEADTSVALSFIDVAFATAPP